MYTSRLAYIPPGVDLMILDGLDPRDMIIAIESNPRYDTREKRRASGIEKYLSNRLEEDLKIVYKNLENLEINDEYPYLTDPMDPLTIYKIFVSLKSLMRAHGTSPKVINDISDIDPVDPDHDYLNHYQSFEFPVSYQDIVRFQLLYWDTYGWHTFTNFISYWLKWSNLGKNININKEWTKFIYEDYYNIFKPFIIELFQGLMARRNAKIKVGHDTISYQIVRLIDILRKMMNYPLTAFFSHKYQITEQDKNILSKEREELLNYIFATLIEYGMLGSVLDYMRL